VRIAAPAPSVTRPPTGAADNRASGGSGTTTACNCAARARR
jgi:hypothetical protein